MSDLPLPQLVPLSGDDLTRNEIGREALLDVTTGQIRGLSPDEARTEHDFPQVRIVGWLPAGEAVFHVSREASYSAIDHSEVAGLYAGYLGGPVRPILVPAGTGQVFVSSRGQIGISREPRGVLITDDQGAEVGALPPDFPRLIGWSPDGQFLVLEAYIEATQQFRSAIWNVDEGELQFFTTDFSFGTPVWSHSGERVAFADGANPDAALRHVRLRDLTTGQEQDLGLGFPAGPFSPDDRYLPIRFLDGTGRHLFRIIDLEDGRELFTVTAALMGAWLSPTRLFFDGNYCTTFDYFTIDMPGINLRYLAPGIIPGGGFFLSPDDAVAAFPIIEGVRLLKLGTGQTRDLPTGAFRPGPSSLGLSAWSPDGKYLTLFKPGGHGLCEGPHDSEPTTVRRAN